MRLDELSPNPIPALFGHLELCFKFVDLPQQSFLDLLEVLDLIAEILGLALANIPVKKWWIYFNKLVNNLSLFSWQSFFLFYHKSYLHSFSCCPIVLFLCICVCVCVCVSPSFILCTFWTRYSKLPNHIYERCTLQQNF